MHYAISLMRPVVWLVNWLNGTEKQTLHGLATGLHPQDYRMVQNPMVR